MGGQRGPLRVHRPGTIHHQHGERGQLWGPQEKGRQTSSFLFRGG